MNIKRLIVSFIFLILFVNIYGVGNNNDLYPEFNIPMAPNAGRILQWCDNSIYGKFLSYSIHEAYPAVEVQKLYKAFLNQMGFFVYIQKPEVERHWVTYNTSTSKWDLDSDSPPAKYFAAWLNKTKHLMFKLTLEYKGRGDDLSVTCTLHPYAHSKVFEEFDKWVTSNSKERELFKFTKQYTMSDHKLDIDRALKENPNNDLIKKYAEMAKENTKELESAYREYKKSLNRQ